MMDHTPKILVVDDEQDLREILTFNLSSEGFDIDAVASAEEALSKSLENYDLILLDVMMSGMSGYRMADIIRKEKKLDIPKYQVFNIKLKKKISRIFKQF